MNQYQNLERFKTQMAAFARGDVDGLLAAFADNAELQDMAEPDSPWTGLAEIRSFLSDYFSHLSATTLKITNVAASNGVVFAELEVRGRYTPDLAMPAATSNVLMRYCVVEEFLEGKIVRERFYWDRTEFESQLGATTAAP